MRKNKIKWTSNKLHDSKNDLSSTHLNAPLQFEYFKWPWFFTFQSFIKSIQIVKLKQVKWYTFCMQSVTSYYTKTILFGLVDNDYDISSSQLQWNLPII